MAIFHLTAKAVSRGAGQSIIAKAAYNAREKLREERTGELKDYSRASGVLFSGIFAPKDAPAWAHNRETLWNEVDRCEDRSTRPSQAQTAREIEIGLPHELTDEQRKQLVTDFVREQFQRKGMIADVNIHEPGGKGDSRNYHAHILLTMREVGPDGFGQKVRDWNSRAQLESWREAWEKTQNRYLERHGHDARVDRRTLEAQGIDRAPTVHKGPHAVAMEARGAETERGNIHRQAFDAAQEAVKLKRELAAITVEIAALEREVTRPTQPKRETRGGATEHERIAARMPEDLRGTSAAIWIAYNVQAQRDPRKFEAALEDNGIRLARVTKDEAEQSRRQADFSKAVGNYARRYTEGELVAVTKGGDVYQLTARNTGQSREAVQKFLSRDDFQSVAGIEATKEIAQKHIAAKAEQREADWQKRRDEAIAGRFGNVLINRAAETAMRDPRQQHGAPYPSVAAFRDALDKNRLAFACVTPEEAAKSQRAATFAKELGSYAPVYQAGEIVILRVQRKGESADKGQVYRLDQVKGEDYLRCASIAKDELQSIERTKQTLQRGAVQVRSKWTTRGGRVQQEMAALRRIKEAAAPRPRGNDDDTRRKNDEYAERQKRDSGEIDPERYRMDPDYRRQAQNAHAYKSPEEKKRDRENDLRAEIEQQGRQR